jgi:hypothetical protein
MSKTVKFILGIFIVIIATGAALALYYKPSFIFHNKTDNLSLKEISGLQSGNIIESTKVPSSEGNSPSFTYSPFIATTFIDTNANGVKDTSENICGSCFVRLLVCTNSESKSLPQTSSLFNITIGGNGVIPTDKLVEGSECWASLDDKKIYIPPFKFEVGDSSGQIDVPVLNASGVFAGVNMNLKSINISDSNYIYEFNLLIPVLQTQFTNKKQVWLKYIPNIASPDTYFMKSVQIQYDSDGLITGLEGTYYLQVNWGFSENYSTDKTIENYTIVM